MIFKYEYAGIKSDPTLVTNSIESEFPGIIAESYYDIINDIYHIGVYDGNHEVRIGEIVNGYNGTYIAQEVGPVREISNVTIEHTYMAEIESVIHSEAISLYKPTWIYVTLNGTTTTSPNDSISHTLSLTTGEVINNSSISIESSANDVASNWSRVWWVFVDNTATTLEISANFTPDVDSVEPYDQDTTLNLIIHEAL